MIGLITLDEKCAGARSAGNPHAACEAEGNWKRSYGSAQAGTKGETLETDKDDPAGHRASPRPYRARRS